MGDRAIRSLVLSVDIGAGHRRAAEAICQSLAVQHPESSYHLVEALDHMGAGAGKLAKDLYFGVLEEAPNLWGALYEQRGIVDLFRPVTEFFDDLNASGLQPIIDDFAPDVILAMHPFACGLAAAIARKEACDCPVVAVLTDFDGHPAWVAAGIDRYLVATDAVAAQLSDHGLPTGDVIVTGIPLRPDFANIRSIPPTKAALGLDPARLTILLLGGGLGLGPIVETARALGSIDGPVELVLISGGNDALREEAGELSSSNTLSIPLHVTGMVENMHDYMRAADLAVTKPGGLTVAELLAAGVPIVALEPIPGQEEANCDALLDAGVAREAADAAEALSVVESLLAAPHERQTMRERALQLGKPTAARVAARAVVETVERWPELRYHRGSDDGEDPFSLKSEAFRLFDKLADKVSGTTNEDDLERRRRDSRRQERDKKRRRRRAPKSEAAKRRQRKQEQAAKDRELEKAFDEVEINDELAELKRELGVDDE